MYFAVAVVIRNIVKGIAGLVFTMPSPPVDVLVTAQPVVLSGRGQTAQAQTTTQTGMSSIHKMVKSTHCLRNSLCGTDLPAMKSSSLYAKHVSCIYYVLTLKCAHIINIHRIRYYDSKTLFYSNVNFKIFACSCSLTNLAKCFNILTNEASTAFELCLYSSCVI